MKYTLPLTLMATLLFMACNQPGTSTAEHKDTIATTAASPKVSVKSLPVRQGPYSQFIPIDSANKMLLSYLNSINYQSNDTDLHSIIFDAGQVRTLLSDTAIKNIKIMFSHSLDYINGGGGNTNCGYTAKELTVIISGYDNNGNYVYNPSGTVLEIGNPCPPNCISQGTASQDLLPAQPTGEKK